MLCQHPAIAQIAIMAVPDERSGEEIFACVVTRGGQVPDLRLATDIMTFCTEHLAYYKAPGWILFMDRIPVTATQKINKAQIFGAGVDPRNLRGVIDLRRMKKRRSIAEAS